jgi:hypothetical protein
MNLMLHHAWMREELPSTPLEGFRRHKSQFVFPVHFGICGTNQNSSVSKMLCHDTPKWLEAHADRSIEAVAVTEKHS